MYKRLYKLSAAPFLLTPDPRLVFRSHRHSRAISHEVYGLVQQEGFIVITGELGPGIATLFGLAWKQRDRSNCVTNRVGTTQVSYDDLQRLIMMSLASGDISDTENATTLRRLGHMLHSKEKQAGPVLSYR